MSISSELLTLQNTKTAIRTAINQKGGSVGASDTFASYATAISNLPTSANKLLTSIDVSDFSGTTFNKVSSYLTSVTIPDTVTTIGQGAFTGASDLTSITLPIGVTSIDATAFQNCSGLTSLAIPSGVTTIGTNTFDGCTHITSFTLPSGVTSIGMYAFNHCDALRYVVCLATTPPTLGTGAFNNTRNCPIYVPEASVSAYKAASNWSDYSSRIYPIQQVATVDGNPVYNYELEETDTYTISNLNKLPSGDVVEIAEGIVFVTGRFGAYEEVILPSTTGSISISQAINAATETLTCKATEPPTIASANLGGSGLTAIYVPAASVETYKAASGWSTHSSIIQAIPVPVMAEITQLDDSVYEIPYDGVGVLDENNVPFEDALAQATDIHITSYATAIGQPYELDGTYYGVFEGDGGTHTLKTVTIDEGLTAIPNQAFASNLGLTTVTLPSTITSIGDYAFGMSDGSGPLGLMSVTIHATTPPTLGTDAVGVKKHGIPPLGKFYVPAASVDTYKAATGWSTWAQYIEAIPSE